MRRRMLLMGGALLVLGAATALAWRPWRRPVRASVAGLALPVPAVPIDTGTEPLVGDPRHGARLFAQHCIACHGTRGVGDGPTGEILRPRPRDLTDPVSVGARPDADLVRLIREGGKALGLSRNMPPFGDLVDVLAAWDLVAYVRTLHARPAALLGPDAGPTQAVMVVLDADAPVGGGAGAPLAPADRRVDLLLAGGSPADLATGRAAPRLALAAAPFETPAGRGVVTVVLDGDGRALRRDVHPPASAGDDAVAVGHARLEARARAALRQRAADVAADAAVIARHARDGAKVPAGERAFAQYCADCHGITGRAVGARVTAGTFRPANLAEPGRVSSVPDAWLRRLLREGGGPLGGATAMPGVSLDSAELDALIAFVRSIPKEVHE